LYWYADKVLEAYVAGQVPGLHGLIEKLRSMK
jgi:hypothetical protein